MSAEHEALGNPNLTVAIALAAGIMAQSVAHHLRIPGIVLLLATGVLLGPDVANVVHPATLGTGLNTLVGFTVAVILFEGGMALDIPRLRQASAPIQRLVTVGALLTFVAASAACMLIMGLSLKLSLLFGSLVVVTGPTVVTPLLKRLRATRNVSTVLEAEGVLIDPVGAFMALFALEVVLAPEMSNIAIGLYHVLLRIGIGGAFGLVGAFLISRMLKWEHLIPEGLENVFTLAMVLVIFQGADAIVHESGIAAVTIAGMAVRHWGAHSIEELAEFKEQLTVLGIGMLFVLLAADVRLSEVQALGSNGLALVVALILVVRPLTVALSTWGTSLSWREKAFISWIGPRGIVAAAVASLFAVRLDAAGIEGGSQLRALVFLVIAVTVVVAGLTGGLAAQVLGVRRPSNAGWVILGAHPLGRLLARLLSAGGQDTILIDVNHEHCRAAEREGLRVLHGNGLREQTLGQTGIECRRGAIAITANEEVNLLFAHKVREEARPEILTLAYGGSDTGVTSDMIRKAHATIFAGQEFELENWSSRFETGLARVERRRLKKTPKDSPGRNPTNLSANGHALPLLVNRGGDVFPMTDQTVLHTGDEVTFLLHEEYGSIAGAQLTELGWVLPAVDETVDAEQFEPTQEA
ncbi:MAG: cation:proton antiporter [Myxococcota bacterium]